MENHIVASVFSGSIWEIIGQTSPFGIFILVILAAMSLISWTIMFHKWREFKAVDIDSHRFLSHFRRQRRLADVAGQAKSHGNAPIAQIFTAGFEERTSLNEIKNEGGALQESTRPLTEADFDIVEMTMEKTLTEEIGKLERKVVFLATTGSSAPFMGLLGTVVGIMDSFWSIGERGSASLAVVAPGIAEALLATIVGLGAAIPAVIAYNWANSRLKGVNDAGSGFILEFMARARKESL